MIVHFNVHLHICKYANFICIFMWHIFFVNLQRKVLFNNSNANHNQLLQKIKAKKDTTHVIVNDDTNSPTEEEVKRLRDENEHLRKLLLERMCFVFYCFRLWWFYFYILSWFYPSSLLSQNLMKIRI